MTIKQKKFIEEYTKTGNGLQSVKKAGYGRKGKKLNDNTAKAIASENLTKPYIKSALEKRLAELELKTDFDVEFVRKNMLLGMTETYEKKDFTNFKGFVELMAKHKAMLTDKLVNIDEVKPMSAQELEDVERLARQYAENRAKIKAVG